MGKLSNIARNISGFGGVYINLNDLIAEHPDGVTITGAFTIGKKDKKTDEVKISGCFIYAEAPDKFFYAEAGDLKKIFDGWLNDCNGNIDELNEQLGYENVKLKIFKKPIGGGKTYTKALVVNVIEKPHIETDEAAVEHIDPETGEFLSEHSPF